MPLSPCVGATQYQPTQHTALLSITQPEVWCYAGNATQTWWIFHGLRDRDEHHIMVLCCCYLTLAAWQTDTDCPVGSTSTTARSHNHHQQCCSAHKPNFSLRRATNPQKSAAFVLFVFGTRLVTSQTKKIPTVSVSTLKLQKWQLEQNESPKNRYDHLRAAASWSAPLCGSSLVQRSSIQRPSDQTPPPGCPPTSCMPRSQTLYTTHDRSQMSSVVRETQTTRQFASFNIYLQQNVYNLSFFSNHHLQNRHIPSPAEFFSKLKPLTSGSRENYSEMCQKRALNSTHLTPHSQLSYN